MRSALIAFQIEIAKIICIISSAKPCNFIIAVVLLAYFKSYLLNTDF